MSDPFTTAIMCITATIWLEARGEPLDGMAAVADTIMVRAAQRDTSPCALVEAEAQYANGRVNIEHMNGPDRAAYDEARIIATKAMLGQGLGLDADHFHEIGILPHWARGQKPIGRIGAHLFYRLDGGVNG